MSLQTRLNAFVQAVGADIKALRAPKVTGTARGQSASSLEWIKQSDGSLVAKVDSYVSTNIQSAEVMSKQGQAGASKSALMILTAEEKGVFNPALGENVAERTQIVVTQEDPLSSSQDRGAIRLYAGNKMKLLFGSAGSSDFAFAIPLVQVLPSTPVHGQEVVFQNQSMMNNGVAWHLRYRMYNVDGSLNTNTDKWECVGGGLFVARDPAGVSLAANTPTFNGPEHSIPLPGFYEYSVGWNGYNSTGVASGILQSQLYNGSNVLWDSTGEDVVQQFVVASGSGRANGSRYSLFPIRLTGGSILRLGYNADFAGSVVRFRHLGIKPVRVSAA